MLARQRREVISPVALLALDAECFGQGWAMETRSARSRSPAGRTGAGGLVLPSFCRPRSRPSVSLSAKSRGFKRKAAPWCRSRVSADEGRPLVGARIALERGWRRSGRGPGGRARARRARARRGRGRPPTGGRRCGEGTSTPKRFFAQQPAWYRREVVGRLCAAAYGRI